MSVLENLPSRLSRLKRSSISLDTLGHLAILATLVRLGVVGDSCWPAESSSMGKVCDLQHIAGGGTILVWVNTGDHCKGTHVHCSDSGGNWEARIGFSFLNNNPVFWDLLSPTGPGAGVFTRICRDLVAECTALRKEWWRIYETTLGCCLGNQTFPDGGGVSRKIATAIYHPGRDATELTFSNGVDRTVRP